MKRNNRLIAVLCTTLLWTTATGAELPANYPAIDEQSFPLIRLSRDSANVIDGMDIKEIHQSTVAYSAEHDIALHAWIALHEFEGNNPTSDTSLFYQLHNARTGAALTQPKRLLTIDEVNCDATVPVEVECEVDTESRLAEAPDGNFFYRFRIKSLAAVYHPVSKRFFVTWGNSKTVTDRPTLGEADLDELSLPGVYAVTVSNTGSEWSASPVLSANLSGGNDAIRAHVFARQDADTLHRIALRPDGNIVLDEIVFDAENGSFTGVAHRILDINDPVDFNSGNIVPSFAGTRSYDVAYDGNNDRYAVAAVLAGRYVPGSSGESDPQYWYYSAIVHRTFDADPVNGSSSFRRTIKASPPEKKLVIVGSDIEPANLHFNDISIDWNNSAATLGHNGQIRFAWVEPVFDESVFDGDAPNYNPPYPQRLHIQRAETQQAHRDLTWIDQEDVALPEEWAGTLVYSAGTAWDSTSGFGTVAWGNTGRLSIYPLPLHSESVPDSITPQRYEVSTLATTPGILASLTRQRIRFIPTVRGSYMHLVSPYEISLRNMRWDWIDLATSSRIVDDGATDNLSTVELSVANQFLSNVPTDFESSSFRIQFEGTEGLELAAFDERLTGDLDNGFTTRDESVISLETGITTTFDFAFRSTGATSREQELTARVLSFPTRYDPNSENDASSVVLSIKGTDGSDGDGDGDGDVNGDRDGDSDGTGGPGGGGSLGFGVLMALFLIRRRFA